MESLKQPLDHRSRHSFSWGLGSMSHHGDIAKPLNLFSRSSQWSLMGYRREDLPQSNDMAKAVWAMPTPFGYKMKVDTFLTPTTGAGQMPMKIPRTGVVSTPVVNETEIALSSGLPVELPKHPSQVHTAIPRSNYVPEPRLYVQPKAFHAPIGRNYTGRYLSNAFDSANRSEKIVRMKGHNHIKKRLTMKELNPDPEAKEGLVEGIIQPVRSL